MGNKTPETPCSPLGGGPPGFAGWSSAPIELVVECRLDRWGGFTTPANGGVDLPLS